MYCIIIYVPTVVTQEAQHVETQDQQGQSMNDSLLLQLEAEITRHKLTGHGAEGHSEFAMLISVAANRNMTSANVEAVTRTRKRNVHTAVIFVS